MNGVNVNATRGVTDHHTMATDQAAAMPTTVRLEHLCVLANTYLRKIPDETAKEGPHLSAGSIVVSICRLFVSGGSRETWYHGVGGEGYLPEAEVEVVAGSRGGGPFELARAPRTTFPEPPRGLQADTTFTCTFNGRIGPFFEAIASVLHHLGDLDRIDSWIVICDGGSTLDQRVEILRALPWATVIAKGPALHRHPVSMNMLLQNVRTRFWLQWEDDWRLPSATGILRSAAEVCCLGFHQVALNGAWLATDRVWWEAAVAKENLVPAAQPTESGARWAEVRYPPTLCDVFGDEYEHAARILSGAETIEELATAFQKGTWYQKPDGSRARKVLLWPLWSNQPSLNDAAFLRALLPFREEAEFARPGWHGLFEFEFGVRFIRAGGRKATLVSAPQGHAVQIKCDSSSTSAGRTRVDAAIACEPPLYVPLGGMPVEHPSLA